MRNITAGVTLPPLLIVLIIGGKTQQEQGIGYNFTLYVRK